MAAYVSTTQLAAEAKIGGAFSDAAPATNPNATKAAEIIAEIEAKINARISRKYVLPISQVEPLALLRGISLALCVERVREIMNVRTGTNNVDQIAAKTTADLARKDLERIVNGEIPLIGEVLASSGDGVRSFAVTAGDTPLFQRGVDQW